MEELHLSLFAVIDCYCCFTRSSLGSLCVRVLSRSAVSRVSGGGKGLVAEGSKRSSARVSNLIVVFYCYRDSPASHVSSRGCSHTIHQPGVNSREIVFYGFSLIEIVKK